ncbi:hypothetical protein H2248_000137 [Termitomyces sp. 'cryptogamus']|nr:hypothetical protein H2248_000137 [Termitomyces sp. 'cryptogamus']
MTSCPWKSFVWCFHARDGGKPIVCVMIRLVPNPVTRCPWTRADISFFLYILICPKLCINFVFLAPLRLPGAVTSFELATKNLHMPPQLWRRQNQFSVAAAQNVDPRSLLESLVLEELPSHSSPLQRIELQTATTQEPIPIPHKRRDPYVIDPHHPSHYVPAFRDPWEISTFATDGTVALVEFGDHSNNFNPHQNCSKSASPPFLERHLGAKRPPSLVDHGSGLPLYALVESWQLLIVEFKAGRVDIFYDSQGQGFHVGDFVIVETGHGKDLGQVVDNTITPAQLKTFQQRQGLEHADSVGGKKMIFPKMIYEKAKQNDIESLEAQRRDEVKALNICKERDRRNNLLLGPLRAEYQWDKHRLTFYCSGKVDTDFMKPAEGLSRLFKTEVILMRLPIGEIDNVYKQYLLNIAHLPHHDSPTQTANRILRSEDEPRQLIKRLTRLFKDKTEYQTLLRCKGDTAQKLLDMLQRLLDILFTPSAVNPGPPLSFQRNLVVATQRLAEKSGLYPKSYELTDVTIPEMPKMSGSLGGFADIYKGIFRSHEVCIKMVRLYQSAPLAYFMKDICKEAILWKQLRHPNVLPFYGIYRYMGRIAFVAPWMKNGDIVEYLRDYPSSDRAVLTYDVINGLEFLHKNGIIHGDLKGVSGC